LPVVEVEFPTTVVEVEPVDLDPTLQASLLVVVPLLKQHYLLEHSQTTP
jgi:hypothetical protein